MKQLLTITVCLFLLCFCLTMPVMADSDGMEAGQFTFSGEDFYTLSDVDGIYICRVPAAEDGALYLGSRVIRAGDFLPKDTLSRLELKAAKDETYQIDVQYQPIRNKTLGEPAVFTMHVQSSKNEAPVSENIQLETYKNIPNVGNFQSTDPEGQPLTFAVENQPTRGSVEVRPDGSFLYTPLKNKVGNDSFTYYATDPEGNRSESAKVEITILEPLDKATFQDVEVDAQFLPMWSRDHGLFGGETVAEQYCFCPERAVSRGEFLATAMKLAGISPELGLRSSGFADQEDAPAWIQSYLVSAMRRGYVFGVSTEKGLLFYPNREITAAEAAAMVERIFGIEGAAPTAAVDGAAPAWDEAAVATAAEAGLMLTDSGSFSRLDAAALLYSADKLSN